MTANFIVSNRLSLIKGGSNVENEAEIFPVFPAFDSDEFQKDQWLIEADGKPVDTASFLGSLIRVIGTISVE